MLQADMLNLSGVGIEGVYRLMICTVQSFLV